MDKNNADFYKKRIRALEEEESRLRRINDELAEGLKFYGIHNPDKNACEVCKLIAKCGY